MSERAKVDPIEGADPACALCGRRSGPVSIALRVCGACIRSDPERALAITDRAHQVSRCEFGLPVESPQSPGGAKCMLCDRGCRMAEGDRGFCGAREYERGRLVHHAGTPRRGVLHWYRDPLPTNCVADWVCAGHRQAGRHNLAVFYSSCTLDCLFCQNWHFRETPLREAGGTSATTLGNRANEGTFCACFFGGDPASQMPHALNAARRLAARRVAVCWETAGTFGPELLDRAVDLSLKSGGCVKFDLKAFDESLHIALTGASNRRILDNFERAAGRARERPDPPLVVASTLLVPGYVDEEEVGRIAEFIAGIDPDTPYALLAFAPQFYMSDLPRTSAAHATAAEAAARAAGLTRVRVGNPHLLAGDY